VLVGCWAAPNFYTRNSETDKVVSSPSKSADNFNQEFFANAMANFNEVNRKLFSIDTKELDEVERGLIDKFKPSLDALLHSLKNKTYRQLTQQDKHSVSELLDRLGYAYEEWIKHSQQKTQKQAIGIYSDESTDASSNSDSAEKDTDSNESNGLGTSNESNVSFDRSSN
jgi:exonuclease VII large subunit